MPNCWLEVHTHRCPVCLEHWTCGDDDCAGLAPQLCDPCKPEYFFVIATEEGVYARGWTPGFQQSGSDCPADPEGHCFPLGPWLESGDGYCTGCGAPYEPLPGNDLLD